MCQKSLYVKVKDCIPIQVIWETLRGHWVSAHHLCTHLYSFSDIGPQTQSLQTMMVDRSNSISASASFAIRH